MAEDYRSLEASELPLRPDPRGRISRNFALWELTRSEIAQRENIDNAFEERAHLEAAIHLTREVLQKVRDEFGPLSPNSVYRGQALERALKNKPADWTSTSQHSRGEACDIEVPSLSTLDLARWIEKNLEYDQLICECYDPARGPNAGWVHVSLKPPGQPNRRESLSYIMDPEARKYVYVPDLVPSIA